MDDGWGVRAGVLSLFHRIIHDAFSQVPVLIPSLDAFIDGFDDTGLGVLRWSGDKDFVSLLHEDDGYAGVLAEGVHLFVGHVRVFEQQFQHVFCPCVGFCPNGPFDGGNDIRRQSMGCRDAQVSDCIDNCLIFDSSHRFQRLHRFRENEEKFPVGRLGCPGRLGPLSHQVDPVFSGSLGFEKGLVGAFDQFLGTGGVPGEAGQSAGDG